MSDKHKSIKMTATTLRIILSLTLLLIVAGATGGFYYGRNILTQYAIDVSHKKVDAQASEGNIQALEKTKNDLAANQDVVEKAEALKSDSEFPEFDIVEDVTKYANQNNLTIESFEFGSGAAGSGTTTPPAGSGGGAAPGAATPKPAAASSGTVSISVSLRNPVNYADLLQFMHDLDQNLPKLKLQGVSVTGAGGSRSRVTVEPLVIQMYTR